MLKRIVSGKQKYCSIEVSSRRKFNLDILKGLKFSFVSVIWIGKYEKEVTMIEPLAMARDLIQRGYFVMLHMPARCFNITGAFKCLSYAKKIGVKSILCIRGGGPEAIDDPNFYDFPYPIDLINYITKKFGDAFEIAVAGYPLMHPESDSIENEMNFMKAKYEAGARFVVTETVFSYTAVKSFAENLKQHGIKMKVIPGVFVMSNLADYILLQKLCKIPNDDELAEFVDKNRNDEEAIAEFGRESAEKLVLSILKDKDLLPPHVFTMNDFEVIAKFLTFLEKSLPERE